MARRPASPASGRRARDGRTRPAIVRVRSRSWGARSRLGVETARLPGASGARPRTWRRARQMTVAERQCRDEEEGGDLLGLGGSPNPVLQLLGAFPRQPILRLLDALQRTAREGRSRDNV